MDQLEKNTNEENIISFLAYFNEIDKYFDKVLWDDWFSPYNEKIKKIAEWNYSITSFVRKHIYQLKNIGELRNFITHGIKSNGETFACPTDAAIEKLKEYTEKITKPAKVLDLFRKKVFTVGYNLKKMMWYKVFRSYIHCVNTFYKIIFLFLIIKKEHLMFL